MLEDHPVTQKALLGAGAFMFVFSAAMAGTAFMISGGFGLDAEANSSSGPSENYLLLAHADSTDNPYAEQNALENWARQLRVEAAAAEAAPIAVETIDATSADVMIQSADVNAAPPAGETNTYAALAEAFATAPPLGETPRPN